MSSCLVLLLPSSTNINSNDEGRKLPPLHCTTMHSSYPLFTISSIMSKLPARAKGNGRFVDTLVLTAFFLKRQHHTLPPSALTHALHFYTFLTITKPFHLCFQAFDTSCDQGCCHLVVVLTPWSRRQNSLVHLLGYHNTSTLHATNFSSIGILYSSSSWS